MSRASIVFLLLFSLGGAGAGTYLLVFPRVESIVQNEAKDALQTAARLMEQMEREDESKLRSKMTDSSMRKNLLKILGSRPGASGSTERWLDDLRVEIAGLTAFVRNYATVSDMFILDAKGKGLVRDVDMHWTGKYPSDNKSVLDAIESARAGKAATELFESPLGVTRAVAVPVGSDGKLLGVLLGFFPLDISEIRSRKSFIESDVDIAVVSGDKITASSMEKSRFAKVEKYFSAHGKQVEEIISGGSSGHEVMDVAGMDAYLAGVSLKPDAAKAPFGMILVRWTDSMTAPLKEIALYFFAGMAMLFIFMSFLVVMLGGGLIRSLKTLEGELLDVVNSGKKRPVGTSGPVIVKSIAHLCSQLISGQPGEADPQSRQFDSLDGLEEFSDKDDDDEDADKHATQDSSDTEEKSDKPDKTSTRSNDEVVEQGEPLSDYYASLYSEFCIAKKELGETVDKLNLGRFRAKLEKQARNIKNKHCCKDVRFEVLVKAGKVRLQPKILR